MQTYFETRDFYLSAYLIVNSCELLSCTNQNGISMFEFQNTIQLNDLVTAFYSMKGTCDALTYAGAVRNLKSIIHAAKADSKSISTSKHVGLNHDFFNQTRGTF